VQFKVLSLLICALALWLGSPAGTASALADSQLRVGIVVSNQAYAELRPLQIPHSDGDRVEAALRAMEFDIVVRLRDAQSGMLEATLADIRRTIGNRQPDVVFVYYSGHGGVLEGRGDNYLFATDSEPKAAGSLATGATKLSDLISRINAWRPDAIVMAIDACRDLVTVSDQRRSESQRAVAANGPPVFGRGMSRQSVSSAPLFVSFATRPGEIALDAPVYSVALSEEMQIRQADVDQIFERVRARVIQATGSTQTPHNENGLPQLVWLQPEFDFDVSLEKTAIWPAPTDFHSPRLFLNPRGGGLWVQSGYWGADHPLRLLAVDAAGQETWRADAVSLNLPDSVVLDTAAFTPDGKYMLGLHVEERDAWDPGLMLLDEQGKRIRAPSIKEVARTGRARIRRIAFDASGDAWIAVNDGPDKAYSFVRSSPDLTQISEFGATILQPSTRYIAVNALLPFDQASVEAEDCMFQLSPCGPLMFAAGALRNLYAEAILLRVSPTGTAGSPPLQASGTGFEFTWVGAKDGTCCLLFGTKQSAHPSSQNSLIFAKANIVGITTSQHTQFLPRDTDTCFAESAAQTDAGMIVGLATCRTGDIRASTIIVADTSLMVGGWKKACESRSCAATEIIRADDGRILTAVSSTDGYYAIYEVKVRPAKGVGRSSGRSKTASPR
jgi:hypothetical protein